MTNHPTAVQDMVFSTNNVVGDIVTTATRLALAPMARAALAGYQLSATEIWIPMSDSPDLDGVFVLAAKDPVTCITAPCPQLLEQRLNSTRSARIDLINWKASDATGEAIGHAINDLTALPGEVDAARGVIVVGRRFTNGLEKGRTANQFWTQAPIQ